MAVAVMAVAVMAVAVMAVVVMAVVVMAVVVMAVVVMAVHGASVSIVVVGRHGVTIRGVTRGRVLMMPTGFGLLVRAKSHMEQHPCNKSLYSSGSPVRNPGDGQWTQQKTEHGG
jgi:hypothetical protein